MLNQFSRTQLLLGAENMDRLAKAKVAIFGIGGVGGYVAEALARSGVGSFVLVDDDKVCLTNINRQIIATRKTSWTVQGGGHARPDPGYQPGRPGGGQKVLLSPGKCG